MNILESIKQFDNSIGKDQNFNITFYEDLLKSKCRMNKEFFEIAGKVMKSENLQFFISNYQG